MTVVRVGDQRQLDVDGARLVEIAHQHLADLHRPADASLERVALGQQHARHAGADRAQSEQPDAQRSYGHVV